MTPKLDRLDLKIIDALHADGRVSNANLAQSVALSESACHRRTRNMEAAGIIAGYRVEVGFERFGALEYLAEATLLDRSEATSDAFETLLMGRPEVAEAFQIVGEAIWCFRVVVPSITAWEAMRSSLKARGDLIVEIEGYLVYRSRRSAQRYPTAALGNLLLYRRLAEF